MAANPQQRDLGVLGEPRVNVLETQYGSRSGLPGKTMRACSAGMVFAARTVDVMASEGIPAVPIPKSLLRQITAQEAHRTRAARLKIFLGYAPRVGKSLRMFDEGHGGKSGGQDVVIGAIQPRGAGRSIAGLIKEFEIVPPLRIADADTIDVEAILRRAPHVTAWWTNWPGTTRRKSRYAHRWQEVEEIRNHGVNVVGAINLQHICDKQQDAKIERRLPAADPAQNSVHRRKLLLISRPM